MARYGQAFKERAVARLLPPESAAITAVSQELGVSVSTLERWRESATTALSQPEELRASPQQTRDDRRWIKELERDLRRKNAALAETTALPVLSKKSRRSSSRAGTNDIPGGSPIDCSARRASPSRRRPAAVRRWSDRRRYAPCPLMP